MDKKNFSFGVDLLKIIGAFLVVLLHTVCSIPLYCPSDLGTATYETAVKIHQFSNIAVPIFFIITGYLFLGRETPITYKHIWPHIRRFLLVLLIFGGIFSLMEQVYTAHSFAPSMLLTAGRDILTGNLWDHMWYIYAAISIYLTLPILSAFFCRKGKDPIYFTALSFVIIFFAPFLLGLFNLSSGFTIPVTYYLFYVLFGGVLSRVQISKGFSICFFTLFLLFVILGVFFPVINGMAVMEYTGIVVCLMASLFSAWVLCLFSGKVSGSGVHFISECTFGIYLLHPVLINLQVKVFYRYGILSHPILSMILNAAVLFFLSLGITILLRKIPVVRRYLL